MLFNVYMASQVKKLNQLTSVKRNYHLNRVHTFCQHLSNFLTQSIQPNMFQGRYSNGIGIERRIQFCRIVKQVNLIERGHTRLFASLQIVQHIVYRFALLNGVLVAAIYYLQQNISLNHLFKGGAKSGDQFCGQLLDKTNRISDERLLIAWQHHMARHRIESSKELIFYQYPGLGQGIEQGRFSSISIAHKSNNGNSLSGPPPPINGTLRAYFFDIFF